MDRRRLRCEVQTGRRQCQMAQIRLRHRVSNWLACLGRLCLRKTDIVRNSRDIVFRFRNSRHSACGIDTLRSRIVGSQCEETPRRRVSSDWD